MPPASFVTVAGAGEVITSWAPVPGATGYEVTLAADASVNHTNFASLPEGQQFALTTTLQRFTGLTNGTTYWAVVRATNASGASPDTGSHHATPTARGTFLAAGAIPVGDSPQGSVTALLDADAFLDIAVVDMDANTVSVFLGNGDGTFLFDAAYPTDVGPESVLAVDLDGDGGLELVTANSSGSLSVLDGDGVGGFADRVDWPVGGTLASIAAGQLNPLVDSFLDIVATDVTGAQVAILYGVGDETFSPPLLFATDTQPVFVHVADVNGDGFDDLLTANAPAGTVTALLADGVGDFSDRHDSPVGLDCSSLDVGDFDGDTVLDVVVSERVREQRLLPARQRRRDVPPVHAGGGGLARGLGGRGRLQRRRSVRPRRRRQGRRLGDGAARRRRRQLLRLQRLRLEPGRDDGDRG